MKSRSQLLVKHIPNSWFGGLRLISHHVWTIILVTSLKRNRPEGWRNIYKNVVPLSSGGSEEVMKVEGRRSFEKFIKKTSSCARYLGMMSSPWGDNFEEREERKGPLTVPILLSETPWNYLTDREPSFGVELSDRDPIFRFMNNLLSGTPDFRMSISYWVGT